jgi:hypothetical protein
MTLARGDGTEHICDAVHEFASGAPFTVGECVRLTLIPERSESARFESVEGKLCSG